MFQLNFTTRVLGKMASPALRRRQVTQTIRSNQSDLVMAAMEDKVKRGDVVEINLDGEIVGQAHLQEVKPVKWADLDIDDARRGGFNNRFELAYALRRAGFRFKSLDQYVFYRCQFAWEEKCQSCTICIGPNFMETSAYQVGKFRICGWCRAKLTEQGHIELDGRHTIKEQGTICRWLYPNGSVKPMKIVNVRYPEPETLFLPINVPLREEELLEDIEVTEPLSSRGEKP